MHPQITPCMNIITIKFAGYLNCIKNNAAGLLKTAGANYSEVKLKYTKVKLK